MDARFVNYNVILFVFLITRTDLLFCRLSHESIAVTRSCTPGSLALAQK